MALKARIRDALPALIRDLVGVGGAGLLIYGVWLVYEPAGYITAGALLMAVAWLAARQG